MPAGISDTLVLEVKTQFDKAMNDMKDMLSEMRALSSVAKQAKKDMQDVGKSGSKSGSIFGAELNDLKKLAPMAARYQQDLAKIAKLQTSMRGSSSINNSPIGSTKFIKVETDNANTSVNALNNNLIKTAVLWGGIYMAVNKTADAIKTGINFNAMLESANVAFEVMLGNVDNAKKLMGDLKALSMYTPIGLEESAKSAKQLVAYGFQMGDLVNTMKMLGTVTAATGGGLDDLAYVYGTLRTQGRAYTRDLMQFAMRGIPIYENLAAVMSVNVSEIKKITEEGKIGFTEVEKAFQRMTGAGGVYFGMLERSMETLTGKSNLMGKQFAMSMGELAKPVETPLKKIVDEITGFLRGNESQFRLIGNNIKDIFDSLSRSLPFVLGLASDLVQVFTFLGAEIGRAFDPLITAINFINDGITSILSKSQTVATNLSAQPREERSKAIAEGMVAVQGGTPVDMMVQQWFIRNFQKDQIDITAARAWADKFNVSVRDVAEAAYDAGYISETRLMELAKSLDDAVPKAKVSMFNFITSLNNLLPNQAKQMWSKTDESKFVSNPFEFISGKGAEIGKLLFDDLETAVRKAGIWVADSVPKAVFDKAGKYLTDGANATIDGLSKAMADTARQINAYIKSNRVDINEVKKVINADSTLKLAKEYFGEGQLVDAYDSAIKDISGRYIKAHAENMTVVAKGLGEELEKLLQERADLVNKDKGKKITWDKWFPKEIATQATDIGIDDIMLENEKFLEQVQTKYQEWLTATKITADSVEAVTRLATDNKNASKIVSDKINNFYKTFWDQFNEIDKSIAAAVPVTATNTGNFINDAMSSINSSMSDAQYAIESFTNQAIAISEKVLKNAQAAYDAEPTKENAQKLAEVQDRAMAELSDVYTRHDNAIVRLLEWSVDQEKKARKDAIKSLASDFDSLITEGLASTINDMKAMAMAGLIAIKKAAENPEQYGKKYTDKAVGMAVGGTAAATGLQAISGSQLGNIISAAITAGPLGALVAIIGELVKSVMGLLTTSQVFQDILNPIAILFEDFGTTLAYFVGSILKGPVELLKSVGHLLEPVIGIVLSFVSGFSVLISALTLIFVPAFELTAAALAWVYNNAILPFMNGTIGAANAIIGLANTIIAWINSWAGTNIAQMALLEEYEPILLDAVEAEEKATAAAEKLTKQFDILSGMLSDKLTASISYLENKLKDIANKQVKTAQDLYEAGAISATQYEQMSIEAMKFVDALNNQNLISNVTSLEDAQVIYEKIQQLSIAEDTVKAIQDLDKSTSDKLNLLELVMSSIGLSADEIEKMISASAQKADPTTKITNNMIEMARLQGVTNTHLKDISALLSKDLTTGTTNTPTTTNKPRVYEEQLGVDYAPPQHRQITPRSQVDSYARSTDNSNSLIVNVTAQGSITTENNIADAIAERLYTRRLNGSLTI